MDNMTLRYPVRSLYGDYLRALIGIVILGTPFFYSGGSPIVSTILGSLLLLFVGFGVRTVIRQVTTISVTPDAIATIGPFGKRIAWDNINRVDLKYFSTRRERSTKSGDGWMQIKIYGPGGCVALDSTLPEFNDLAARIADAAFRNGAEMSDTTIENFTTLVVTVTFPEEVTECNRG